MKYNTHYFVRSTVYDIQLFPCIIPKVCSLRNGIFVEALKVLHAMMSEFNRVVQVERKRAFSCRFRFLLIVSMNFHIAVSCGSGCFQSNRGVSCESMLVDFDVKCEI